MGITTELSEKLRKQISDRGMSPEQVERQLERFQKGFPDLELVRPATIDDGILRIPETEQQPLIERFKQAQNEGRVMKFVPASGAATRMFKTLQSMLNAEDKLTREYLEANPDDADAAYTRIFLEHLEIFPFYEDLQQALKKQGLDVVQLKAEGDYRTLLSYILEEKGLGYSSLPKVLIPFHRYEDHQRAPLEEHLVEAKEYTQGENGNIRIHFTISREHESAFHKRLQNVRTRLETGKTTFLVETSFQKPQTDTIAADTNNQPFFDENGDAVFRPGGHGALLTNLEELKGDIVFIKNIDNIVPDHLRESTYQYKKVIGGYLIAIQDQIFFYLKQLDRGDVLPALREEMVRFVQEQLYVEIPPEIFRTEDSKARLDQWLFDRLNRPIRVCGMVKHEGEPGGGPFIVRNPDGTTSLQIVEDAQINHDNPEQTQIFESSTHFNPTDLVCSLRDFQGQPFELEKFRDPETGFISMKSYQGRDLQALELPGLWNGSMAFWNSIFIEVPPETFSPVKTINDLLRKEHRNE